jgi:hypothetical protein
MVAKERLQSEQRFVGDKKLSGKLGKISRIKRNSLSAKPLVSAKDVHLANQEVRRTQARLTKNRLLKLLKDHLIGAVVAEDEQDRFLAKKEELGSSR